MRNSVSEKLNVIIWKCSTNMQCFLPLLIWKYKMMTKTYSICMPNWSWLISDLYTSFNEAAHRLAWSRLCQNVEFEMTPFLELFFLLPAHLIWLLSCSYEAGAFMWIPISHSCRQKQPGREWQCGFSCIKRCMWSTENKISFCLWWVQFSNYYGIWRKCQCSDFV